MIFILMAAGRPPKFVSFDGANYVVGLSAQPWKGSRIRYYATFSKPRKWFGVAEPGDGKAEKKVVEAYRAWLAERGEEIQFLERSRRKRGRLRRQRAVNISPQYQNVEDPEDDESGAKTERQK